MLSEPLDVTLKVVNVFNRLGIDYLIGGSLASAVYGTARSTLDSDLVTNLSSDHIPALVQALQDEFYIDGEMVQDAIEQSTSFNLIHLETMFKVDVFILKGRPFDKVEFDRRIRRVISNESPAEAFFASPEDIILVKLDWFRQGGEVSERQWRDVLGVLLVQAERLDMDYLQEWAAKLGINDLLEKARIQINHTTNRNGIN